MKVRASLVLTCALWAGGHAQLDNTVLNDLRIAIEFDNTEGFTSGYISNTPGQEDMKKGIDLAMRMWQSIVPEFHYRWVTSNPNIIWRFGKYGNSSPRTTCPAFPEWQACSFFPSNGFLPDNPATIIYVNDKGTTPFYSSAMDFISRGERYGTYEPATYPPSYYNIEAGNPGFLAGRWRGLFGEDLASIAFHEWGHSMGMGHRNYDHQQLITWYGQNSQVTSDPNGYGLPVPYYGGGTCATVSYLRPDDPPTPPVQACNDEGIPGGSQSSFFPIPPALRQLSPLTFSHYFSLNGVPPQGIPQPPYAGYNNRFVFHADMAINGGAGSFTGQIPDYPWEFPGLSGVIRMETNNGGPAYLTSNWINAMNKGQMLQATQSGPYYVTGIFPRANAQLHLVAGNSYGSALKTDGTLWSWGINSSGQLGLGATGDKSSPQSVSAANAGLPPFASVSSANCHTLALATDGRIFGSGCNESGRIGNGNNIDQNRPVEICNNNTLSCYNQRYAVIAAGGDHSLALRDNGTLWTWGGGSFGELGNGGGGRFLPGQVGTDNSWVTVAASANYHSAGIKKDGSLWLWGRNADGELGINSTSDISTPTRESGWSNAWASVAMGWNNTFAIRTDGSLWSTGSNSGGQLGVGSAIPVGGRSTVFTRIGTSNSWKQVAGGYCHTVGLQADGSLWAWGCNNSGQLGNNSQSNTTGPVRVCDPGTTTTCNTNSRYQKIEAGGGFTLAVGRDGKIYGWGENANGQLGIGSALPGGTRSVPVSTNVSRNVLKIAASTPGSTIPLSAEGLNDWWHWGLSGVNGESKDVSRQLKYTAPTVTPVSFNSGSPTFQWGPDGTFPSTSGSTATAIYITGTSGQYRFTVPSGPSSRTLRIYASVYKATGQITANMSDGSFTNQTSTVSNSTGTSNRVFTITYSSTFNTSTRGKFMTVDWKMTQDFGGGRLILQGATLQ